MNINLLSIKSTISGALLLMILISCKNKNKITNKSNSKFTESIKTKEIVFESEGVKLVGTIYSPKNPEAAVVLVHGSDSVPRMRKFAKLLAENNIKVLTYDKRGVGASKGVYVGPEVGTNNISIENLELLTKDANAAVDLLQKESEDLSIGLLGFSQAGWIIPITTTTNKNVKFMVLFSCPTITTLEQLRFQFYTNGNKDFWETHTTEEAVAHTKNDPDKYQFKATDPLEYLERVSVPGLWLFGEKDIQIPVSLCIENLNQLKAKNKPFDYVLFPELGHNTGYSASTKPFNIAIDWIKSKTKKIE